MGTIALKNVQKKFGDVDVIPGVDLAINNGEFVVFVGPSGCGKSTLLRMIAGLEDTTGGEIVIDGGDVTNVPPARRGLAMVFQSYALYPHMTVRENIAFGLQMAGQPKEMIDQKVAKAAATLNLTDYLDRKPRALSGGQRQRVAIGRAIVREPKVFLFDEPLSNLDAALRVHMRIEIMQLHSALGATMIYVTHDQVEAMTMADRIVVLNKGRIEQVGTPAGALQPAGHPVRRRVHRLAEDELPAGRRGAGAGRADRGHPAGASGAVRPRAGNGRARSCWPSIWAPTPSSMWMAARSGASPPGHLASSRKGRAARSG